MREKLNENPVAQIAVIGVLAIIVGLMLMRSLSGPKPGAEQPDLGVTPAMDADAPGGAAPAPAAAPGTDGTAPAPAPTSNGGEPAPAPAGGNGNGSAFVAGPGLPKDVAVAFDDNKVIALLIVRRPAIDDQRVTGMVEGLKSRNDTAVFIVKAFDVAKYSRIAQGVNVDRTPALVVVQPKRLTQGPMPVATVTYGYRGQPSIDQQIRDALYHGHSNLPYYPTD